MRKTLLCSMSLMASLVSFSAFAGTRGLASGPIAFSCSTKAGTTGFDLKIASTGEAVAELNQNGKSYSCPLKISKFNDRRKARVPSVGVTLARKDACTPALPAAFSKSLKGDFALNLVKAGRKPASNVSFLSKKDDANCAPTNFRVADFNNLIKKWNGTATKRR